MHEPTRGLSRYMLTALAVVIVCILLFPLVWVVLSSFQQTAAFYDARPSLIPARFTLENYRVLATQLVPLGVSITVGVLSALFCVLVGAPAGYAISMFAWRWAGVATTGVLVTQVVPSVLLATPLYLIFSQLRLLNSIPALVLADCTVGVPFTILVIAAFVREVPKELREAALIDGAGEGRVFFSVVLPVVRPAILSAALFAFLFAWGDFLWAVTLSTNGSVTPLSLSIFQYITTFRIDWGAMMATATIAVVPSVLLLVIAQRYISAGLGAGAVKE